MTRSMSGVTVTDFGTLGGPESAATAINAAGQMVGWAETADGARHAFLCQAGAGSDVATLVVAPATGGIGAGTVPSRSTNSPLRNASIRSTGWIAQRVPRTCPT